jgi:hypothetical protein
MNLRQRLLDRARTPARLQKELRLVRKELRALRNEVSQMHQEHTATRGQYSGELERIVDILRLIYDEEPATRRRLYELRDSPDYDRAFTEPEPLVSIIIPTFDRPEMLAQRSIPSALAQTYRNIEVLVVGDAAPARIGAVVEGFDDPRVSYSNRNLRGPYPTDFLTARSVFGGPPFNEGVRQAQGRWIACLTDDDAFRSNHVETLLRAAQRGRYEVCYGRVRCLLPDGTERELGRFPPQRRGHYAQASLYHRGLSFMEMELGDALFGEANDRSLCRRMLRAGVRFGFVDAVVTDYWWYPRYEGQKPPRMADKDGKKRLLGWSTRTPGRSR